MLLLVYFFYFIFFFPFSIAQFSARSLDSLLQDYAFRAFVRPKTGIPYEGKVPVNLTGIKIAAMRLRSGSLRRRGVKRYKEFQIPIGVYEQPYVERLVFVYQNLANWSNLYYPLPGFTYLSPILGLLAYDASNLSAKNLQELEIRASKNPITVHLLNVQEPPQKGLSPMCVYFGLDGSVEFDNVINKTVCSTTKQGHFSIAVQYTPPAPPAPSPAGKHGGGGGGGRKDKKKLGIIIGSVVGGGFGLLIFLGALFTCLKKCRIKKRIQRMEAAADTGEPLLMANIGHVRAPMASETRTRPVLENDYMP